MTKKIDPELLRQILRYEPETGKLFWLPHIAFGPITEGYAKSFNSRWAGTEAFTSKMHNGYFQGHVLSSKQASHRVIWALVYGEWPIEVDHINGDRSDNRLANLREVDRSQNCRNAALRKSRVGATVGVRFNKGAWQATITSRGKRQHLGRFQNKDEAIAVRKAAERNLGFHANHGRQPS
jgi:hypothetical protein